MTLANDSILVTPGSGATVATHIPSGSAKEYQAFVGVDQSGHVIGSTPTYIYSTPTVVVGASKLYLDMFNASGSGKTVCVRGIWIVPQMDVAVAVVIGVRVDFYRTSAVGTGGTAAAYKSATPDVAGGNINPLNTSTAINPNLPAQVTARHLPTGGATIAQWLFQTYTSPEESPPSTGYLSQYSNLIPVLGAYAQGSIDLREGEGLLAKQGTVAGLGSIGFLVAFTVEP